MRPSATRLACLLLSLVALALGLPAAASAATAGELDTTYGSAGRADVGPATSTTYVFDTALDQQGRAVVVGHVVNGGFVERLLADGRPDPSFGQEGIVTIGTSALYLHGVVVQPDGKIVASGDHAVSPSDFGDVDLYRFNPDGSLDTGFGTGGHVAIARPGQQADGGIALQADGKIVVAGFTGGGEDGAVWRLLPDGSLDSSFDGDGERVLNAATLEVLEAVALAPDGKIVVAGSNLSTKLGEVFRLNTDGSLDTGFATGGVWLSPSGNDETLADVAVRPSGAVVASGSSGPGGITKPTVEQLTDAGKSDTAFGAAGEVRLDLGERAYSEAELLQPDGKLVVTARTGGRICLHRLLAEGNLDPSFGTDGVSCVAVSEAGQLRDAVLQADGAIVLAGYAGYRGFAYRFLGDQPTRETETPAGSPPSPGTSNPAPLVSALRVSPARFRVAGATGMTVRRRGAHIRIAFNCSTAGTVRIAVVRVHRTRGGQRSLKQIGVLGKRIAVTAGRTARAFSGRLRGHPLKPGRYRIEVTETGGDGATSNTASAGFTVMR